MGSPSPSSPCSTFRSISTCQSRSAPTASALSFTSLRKLELSSCTALTAMPDLSGLKDLSFASFLGKDTLPDALKAWDTYGTSERAKEIIASQKDFMKQVGLIGADQ